jgi:hypothetical protein
MDIKDCSYNATYSIYRHSERRYDVMGRLKRNACMLFPFATERLPASSVRGLSFCCKHSCMCVRLLVWNMNDCAHSTADILVDWLR